MIVNYDNYGLRCSKDDPVLVTSWGVKNKKGYIAAFKIEYLYRRRLLSSHEKSVLQIQSFIYNSMKIFIELNDIKVHFTKSRDNYFFAFVTADYYVDFNKTP